ncbi:MAG: MFS transporter [Actinomycetota bacterium]
MSSPLRRALASRPFRRLLLARTLSRWGDIFRSVALVVLVFRLTGSGLDVGVVTIVQIVPLILFGFVAGAVVDRLPRARVMVASDVGRGLLALALVAVHDRLWAVYVIAFGLAALSTFFSPAAVSLVPALVEREEDLVGANAVLTSSAVLSQIVLAPVAGAMVAIAGPGPAFAFNAVTFFLSAALLARLRAPRPPQRVAARSYRQDVAEGLALIRSSPLLRSLAEVQALAALSAGATSALLVVLAERHLGAGPERYGMLLTAIAVGQGVGPLVLQRLFTDVRRPVLLFGPFVVRGAVDVVLALSASFGLALGALAVYGLMTNTGGVTFNTLLQQAVPDEARGRAFAFFDVVWQVGRLASVGLGAVLVEGLGVRGVYLLGGGLLLCAGGLGFALVPATRMRPPDVPGGLAPGPAGA